MTITFYARFDGKALIPEQPLALPTNQRLTVTAEVEQTRKPEAKLGEPYSFLRIAAQLELDGLPDWSTRLGGG